MGLSVTTEPGRVHHLGAVRCATPPADSYLVSGDNALLDPYCGNKPRPEFLATRDPIEPVDMNDEAFQPLQSRKSLCEKQD